MLAIAAAVTALLIPSIFIRSFAPFIMSDIKGHIDYLVQLELARNSGWILPARAWGVVRVSLNARGYENQPFYKHVIPYINEARQQAASNNPDKKPKNTVVVASRTWLERCESLGKLVMSFNDFDVIVKAERSEQPAPGIKGPASKRTKLAGAPQKEAMDPDAMPLAVSKDAPKGSPHLLVPSMTLGGHARCVLEVMIK
jgi:hypothetical protein